MTRLVALCVAVVASFASVRAAHAELTGNPTITFDKFYIQKGDDFVEPTTDEARRFYLNRAHCVCAKANAGPETEVQYDIKASATTTDSAKVEVWTGTSCDSTDLQTRLDNCLPIEDQTIPDFNTLFNSQKLTLNLFDVINARKNAEADACIEREGDAAVWLLADVGANQMYEYTTSTPVGTTAMVKGVDTQPPPLPTDLAASPGEASVVISWTPSESRLADVYGYQALCMRADSADPVFTGDALKKPLYQSASSLCDSADPITITATELTLPGESPVTLPAAFASLDKAFVCGEEIGNTKQTLAIEKLENGVPYAVALVTVDLYGNFSATYFTSTITPQPVIDLWEDINDRNSAIDGGCLLSKTYGDGGPLTQTLRAFRDQTLAQTAYGRWLIDAYYTTLGALAVESLPARILAGIALAPLVAIALLWHALSLPGLLLLAALPWLWRRRSRRAALAAAIACVLAPGLAAADDFTPYWEDPSASPDDPGVDGDDEVKWIAGIRVGPYVPEIDLQLGLNARTGQGPYEAMFGDYFTENGVDENGATIYKRHDRRVWQALPMLDVDRILWRGFGQLGVGGSIGYMQKTGRAYKDNTSEDDIDRERSASKTSFRLIPLAATVTYRFTYLDDRWGVPIVPYVRGGLSYYVWWMNGPNGVSKACDSVPAEGMECADEDKAYGGTFGFQGSLGLAIRAERIDSDAARSMRNSGMLHAGFYAELSWAKVDGFGSSSKLSVGDTTWFGGVNFEF